jgi:hypothetical protein
MRTFLQDLLDKIGGSDCDSLVCVCVKELSTNRFGRSMLNIG